MYKKTSARIVVKHYVRQCIPLLLNGEDDDWSSLLDLVLASPAGVMVWLQVWQMIMLAPDNVSFWVNRLRHASTDHIDDGLSLTAVSSCESLDTCMAANIACRRSTSLAAAEASSHAAPVSSPSALL